MGGCANVLGGCTSHKPLENKSMHPHFMRSHLSMNSSHDVSHGTCILMALTVFRGRRAW